jgi:spermidine synthase
MMSYGGWDRLVQTGEGARTRSYFGIYTISDRVEPRARMLTHGTTLHGVQNLAPGMEKEPTSYYARRSGVGHAMQTAAAIYDQPVRIGVVGLGSGTLSCFAQPGQKWTFFEIDPAMVRIARDSGRFTFLRRCAPQARIVLGDARLSLARAAPASFNLLAIDAFSSDSVPMHLLTREALQVYRRALTKDGLLLIHISNRYLDLEPVLAQAAKADGWHAALYEYVPAETETTPNLSISVWIALSRDREALFALRIFSADDAHLWRPLIARPGFSGWSDDHASILPLLEDWRNWLPEQFRGN